MKNKSAITSGQDQIARNRLQNPKFSEATRYKELFDQIPVGMLEENYSIPKQIIDSLGFDNSTDLRQYFSENPETLLAAIRSVEITDVNSSALRAYGARTVEEFVDDHTDFDYWLNDDWVDFYIEELVALFDQELPFQREFTDESLDNKEIIIRNVTRIVAGCEDDWTRIISTVEDVTERKQAEKTLRKARDKPPILLYLILP